MATSVSEEIIASVYLEDGGNKFLWNIGNHIQDYMASNPGGQNWPIKIYFISYDCTIWSLCCAVLGMAL
jgi:hypothetical protein